MVASNNPDYVEFLVHFGCGSMLRPPDQFWGLVAIRDPSSVDWNNPSAVIASGLDSGSLRANALMNSSVQVPGKQSFSVWLKKALKKEMAGLGQRKLNLLRNKPEPFSEVELEMIQIRQAFELEHVEPASANAFRIRVRNRSNGRLRFLSVKAQLPGRGSQVLGLETGSIDPGACGEILRTTSLGGELTQLIVKKLPDPCPEDRYRYFEFECFVTENG
jgi:hypothetical protein